MPKPHYDRVASQEVVCPSCQAHVGQSCRTPDHAPHFARIMLALADEVSDAPQAWTDGAADYSPHQFQQFTYPVAYT